MTIIPRKPLLSFNSLNPSHTLLSFQAGESWRALRAAGPLGSWEADVSFNKGVGAGRARGAVVTFGPRESSVSQLSFKPDHSHITLRPREATNTLLTDLSLQSINTRKARLSRISRVSRVSFVSCFPLHSRAPDVSLVPLGALSPWDTGWTGRPYGAWISRLSRHPWLSLGPLHGGSGLASLSWLALGAEEAWQTLVPLRPWHPWDT